MSGPKVVRIVTREEIIAICENLLRQLDQTIATWTSEGKRMEELSDAEIASTLARRREFSELLNRDGFADLQKNVPDEMAFLQSDLERRRQCSVEKLVQARQRRRQGRINAATLLRTFLRIPRQPQGPVCCHACTMGQSHLLLATLGHDKRHNLPHGERQLSWPVDDNYLGRFIT